LADGGVIAAAGPYRRFPCGPHYLSTLHSAARRQCHCSRINSEPKYSA